MDYAGAIQQETELMPMRIDQGSRVTERMLCMAVDAEYSLTLLNLPLPSELSLGTIEKAAGWLDRDLALFRAQVRDYL